MASQQAGEPGEDDEIEAMTQSFLLRIWPVAQARRQRPWRGTITHVQSGARRGVQSPGEITRFIRRSLERVGVSWRGRWWRR